MLATDANFTAFSDGLKHPNERCIAGTAWALSSSSKYSVDKLTKLLDVEDVATHAVLDVIERDGLCEKAKKIGETIGDWAGKLQAETNCIGDIRIMGAMCAIEFVRDGDADSPDADLTKAIAAEALANGVILLTCGVRGNVIRFLPALTVEPQILTEALDVTGNTIRKLAGDLRKAS